MWRLVFVFQARVCAAHIKQGSTMAAAQPFSLLPAPSSSPPPQGTEGHNTAQIGGFVMLPPVVFANMAGGREAARKAALTHLGLTHDSSKLAAFASEYAGLLYDLATGVGGSSGAGRDLGGETCPETFSSVQCTELCCMLKGLWPSTSSRTRGRRPARTLPRSTSPKCHPPPNCPGHGPADGHC